MGKRKTVVPLSTNESCNLFVGRVKDLARTDLPKVGAWRLSGSGDPNASHCPSRDQLIAFLTFFRQFFLYDAEPVSVKAVTASLRQVVQDQDLLDAIAQIDNFDPFKLSLQLQSRGRNFNLRQLTEAFVSKYFHSDRIPPELADDGYSWQVQMFPLALALARGTNAVLALHAVILESARRGFINLT